MTSPTGLLGVPWGDDPLAASARLGVRCDAWQAWEGDNGVETCFDIDHRVEAFGHQAYVRLFRLRGRVEALSLRFPRCGAIRYALTEAIRNSIMLDRHDGALYHTFDDGAVVHVHYDGGDDSCEVTFAGPRFGTLFGEHLLEQGFKGLANGLRPH